MRYVINTTDGTITDCADTVILDTDYMDNETYSEFLDMNEHELIRLAATIGIPVSSIPQAFLNNVGDMA